MNIQALINDKVSQALEAAGAPAGSPAAVRQSAKAQFGDYQANGVMGVAKNWVRILENLHKKYWMFLTWKALRAKPKSQVRVSSTFS
ncbi:arginyl-tRNA synthetase [Vibrio nigripulchritudo ATCC 27043]|nr:arginyl-tRNA synthetase [Vibrio nigripulchritudo ATCC 27043]